MGISSFQDVEVLCFDVFGTVVDWHGTIVKTLRNRVSQSPKLKDIPDREWSDLALEWREGFWRILKRKLEIGDNSLDVDRVHRELLDEILSSERWHHVACEWDENDRREITRIWHQLDGWPDSSPGLFALKKKYVIATLMNGNMRMVINMAKHANLPWDTVMSAELFGALKPDPVVYKGAIHHLAVKPEQCVMVAAHIYDLLAAGKEGMRTVYVQRNTEDTEEIRAAVKPKDEGGEVDLVVYSLEELAEKLFESR